jgi:hypothetical protein
LPHPFGWTIGQGCGQFFAPAPDGFLVQASDLGEQPIAAMTDAVRFEGDIPAPLGFIEPTEQEIHLLMQAPSGMIAWLLTLGTLAE